MTSQPSKFDGSKDDELKIQVVDALLDALYENKKQHAQSMVSQGMQFLEEKDHRDIHRQRSVVPKWMAVTLATAALVLLALFFSVWGTANTAMAAVARSIEQAMVDVGRHYKMTTTFRVFPTDGGGQSKLVQRNADLFVNGAHQFAIQADGPIRKRSVWLGADHGKAWVVPPIGPVLTGSPESLLNWATNRDDITTPYLHVSTILERMRDSFELEMLPLANLESNGTSISCDHISGILKTPRDNSIFPDRIDLWADSKTGIAIRVVAEWSLAKGVSGRESLTIEFLENYELNDEFFKPESHGGAGRSSISFGLKGDR